MPKRHFSNEFTSEQLKFAEIHDSDADDVLRLFSDPRVCRPMGMRCLTTSAEVRIFIASRYGSNAFNWSVRTKDGNAFAGVFSLHDINWNHRVAQLGGGLLPNKWRKGYGLEIVNRLLGFAFNELTLHRIEAHIYPENLPMKRLFLKAGFKIEGWLRENFRCQDEMGDTLVMGLLRRQFVLAPAILPY